MGVITFNGLSSSTYGILVEHPPGYHIPERDYEYIHVPGRNGDLIIDKGSYKNGKREYEIAFASEVLDYQTQAVKVAEWLHSASGYADLYDTYEPDFVRRASYVDEVDIENILFHAGRATIEFNCKPQRYFRNGQTPVRTNSGSLTLINPSSKPSLPLIKVTGTNLGTVSVSINGNLSVTVSNVTNIVAIDSETQNVYANTVSLNNNTVLATNYFPTLLNSSGNVRINVSSTGSITQLEVTPRWWTL